MKPSSNFEERSHAPKNDLSIVGSVIREAPSGSFDFRLVGSDDADYFAGLDVEGDIFNAEMYSARPAAGADLVYAPGWRGAHFFGEP